MAHFVKLIGSLQLDGSRLVALNFSFDYTAEVFPQMHCVTTALRFHRIERCL